MDLIFKIDSLHMFQKVSNALITNLYNSEKTYNTEIESDIYQKAKNELRAIMFECDFETVKIQEYFLNKTWQQERLKYFQTLIDKNWTTLLNGALNHHNSNYGDYIVEFDWILKYVLGTSELKTLKYPLLQLMLSTLKKDGQQSILMYDITKDKLKEMINVLENI